MSFLFPSSTITFDAALRDIGSGSAKARAMAAHALGGVTGEVEKRRAVDALIRALDDDKAQVRAEACASLGELREPAALPALFKRLDDGEPVVRQNAAIALGTIGHPDAIAPLVTALKEGPADLRYQATTSLAEIDPARALEPALAALDDRDSQVVGAAALSLGAIGDRDRARVITALTAKLDHADANVRFEVAYALAARKVHVRGLAVERLGEVGASWAKGPLERLARSGKGGELLEAIATALRAIGAREGA